MMIDARVCTDFAVQPHMGREAIENSSDTRSLPLAVDYANKEPRGHRVTYRCRHIGDSLRDMPIIHYFASARE